jgi:TIR domain
MTHDVFISHSSHDRDAADAACAALEQRGFSCWIAPRDVLPAQDYGEAIVSGIGGSRLLLLIFSAETNESVRARREFEQAGGQNLPVVAFRIADIAPSPTLQFLIGEGQWLDALTPPIAPHLDYLGDRVALLLGEAWRGPLQPTLPPRPFPKTRRAYGWLPIALAGLAGLAAIALAAAYVSPTLRAATHR